jgi:hypothetical protein
VLGRPKQAVLERPLKGPEQQDAFTPLD